MNNIGIVKKIDALGRLVIPKEIRKLYNLDTEAELIVTENGLLIRKPKEILCAKL